MRLWKGKENQVKLRIDGPLTFTAPIGRAALINYTVETDIIIAPLPASYPVGWLVLSDDEGELYRVRLVTEKAYARGNIFKRAWHAVRLLFLT
jgi:D-alanyl-D-alanine carboxypeptidase (penicillin-binding protein 5/6)